VKPWNQPTPEHQQRIGWPGKPCLEDHLYTSCDREQYSHTKPTEFHVVQQ